MFMKSKDELKEGLHVLHSNNEKEPFRPRIIGDTILKETGITEELARRIQARIVRKLHNLRRDGLTEITTKQIRNEVSVHLLQEREFEAEQATNKGVVLKEEEILELLTAYDNNNANQIYGAGALEYSLFELVSKKYMNSQYSREFREAKEEGLIYPHDAAQELFKGINCFTIDPRFVLKKGLCPYGDNNLGVISSAPNHLRSAVNLVEEALGLATCYIAGGVSIPSIGVFFAPFSRGVPDSEVKQTFQEFMYRLNQSHKNRGSQSMFSSIQMDLEMPEFLRNQEAIGPGGEPRGVYGDYEDENKRICHIITELALEGDSLGKPIFFPNMIYNIDNADLTEWKDVFELCSRFSIPYFLSPNNNGVDYQTTLGCRSGLANNWSGDPNTDCMGTGNSVYTTICLPAIALKAKEEDKEFYHVLDEYMQILHDYNLNRLEWIKKLWYDYGTADYLIQTDEDGNPLYDLENATIVMGYLGLSEALEILGYGPLHKANDKAREVMKYMRKTVDDWKEEDGLRWGLFQTPAENAAYKLAQKMVKKYGFKKSKVRGSKERPYYTNSNHIPYDEDVGILNKIRIEGNNQPIGPAGNILNIYTSETYSEPTALAKFCERIRDKTNAYFWAFTGDYSICNTCSSLFKGVVTECPFDKAETTQFSRVTGYLTAVETWNPGKREEFVRRHRY